MSPPNFSIVGALYYGSIYGITQRRTSEKSWNSSYLDAKKLHPNVISFQVICPVMEMYYYTYTPEIRP